MDDLHVPKSDEFSLNLSGEVSQKKKKRWPMLIVAAVLIVVAAVLLWTPVKKLFWPDKPATLQDVERAAFTKTLDKLTDECQSWLAFDGSEPVGKTAHLEFDIDEVALLFIKKQFPDLAFLDALNTVSADMIYENDGDKVRLLLTPVHDSVDLPEGEAVLDLETQYLYFMIHDLSNKHLKFDLNEFSDRAMLLTALGQNSESELDKALKAYVDGFVDLMKVKNVSQETASVGEVQQKCTKYTAEISLTEFLELTVDTLEELTSLCESDPEITARILSVEEKLQEVKDHFGDGVVFWTVYSDANGSVIGREIKLSEDDKGFRYLCAKNEDALALEAEVYGFSLTGSASCKDNKLDGSFYLSVNGVRYLEINPKDIDLKDIEKGELQGTLRLTPSKELMELVLGADLGITPSLDIEFNITGQGSRFTLNLMDLAAISVYLKDHEAGSISIPGGTEIDGSAGDALYSWLQSIDMDQLKSKLSEIGF